MNDNAQTLVVGSFNLRVPCDQPPNDWPNRGPRAIKTIRQAGFHIFGVQETIPLQLQTITDNTNYRVIGHGREADRTGESSSVLYDPEHLELIAQETFWLSLTPDVPASKSWESSLPRIATVGLFKNRLTGKELVFANTHLHHQNKFQTQLNQLKVLFERLKPYQQRNLPLILTGDFNAGPRQLAPAYAASVLKDARKTANTPVTEPEGPTYHGYLQPPDTPKPNPAPERIDYIFVSDDINVISYQTLNNFDEQGLASSDHYPIRAEITLP